jgi:hypothetical protein
MLHNETENDPVSTNPHDVPRARNIVVEDASIHADSVDSFTFRGLLAQGSFGSIREVDASPSAGAAAALVARCSRESQSREEIERVHTVFRTVEPHVNIVGIERLYYDAEKKNFRHHHGKNGRFPDAASASK